MQNIDIDLLIDEEELQLRNQPEVILDDRWKLMARESRVGLAITKSDKWAHEGREVRYLDLRCVAAPHPECWLEWFKLTIKFDDIPALRIEQMSPETVKSTEPVKITATYKGGFSLDILTVKLGPHATYEKQHETDHYFSEIRSSGKHFNYAQWIFQMPPGQILHINQDVQLLISYPPVPEPLNSSITIRSRIRRKGVSGYLPLVGRRQAMIEVQKGLG